MVCLTIDDKWLGGDELMLPFTALHLNSSELKIMSVVSAELAHTFFLFLISWRAMPTTLQCFHKEIMSDN